MADEWSFPKGDLMKGKKGLIMGVANSNSIAWGIASQLAAQGAELAFTYLGEGLERRVRPLAESVGAKLLIQADVTDDASMDAAFAEIGEGQLGPLRRQLARDAPGDGVGVGHPHDQALLALHQLARRHGPGGFSGHDRAPCEFEPEG